MKKSYILITMLAVVLGVISSITLVQLKTLNQSMRYYEESFFRSSNNLIENYQAVLDYEKSYIVESNHEKKQQMLETHHQLFTLINNHSSSVRSMLYKQVNNDQYVLLETSISKEILLFQEAKSDDERERHVEQFELALKNFKNYLDEMMEQKGICILDSCQK